MWPGLKQSLRGLFTAPNEAVRDAWVMAQLARIAPGSKLLDAGCGTQPYRKYANELKYYAQDFAKYDGTGDKGGLQTSNFSYGQIDYIGNIWEIPEQNLFFDAILCTEVLEHLPFPNETLQEFGRLLKPGGVLLLTAPFASIPHMTPYFYFSGFSQNYYREKLPAAGFEIISVEANGDAFAYMAQELARLRQSFHFGIIRIFFSFFAANAIILLKLFRKLSHKNSDYLVFGYHIHARKI